MFSSLGIIAKLKNTISQLGADGYRCLPITNIKIPSEINMAELGDYVAPICTHYSEQRIDLQVFCDDPMRGFVYLGVDHESGVLLWEVRQ
jgi:hypothetical protein